MRSQIDYGIEGLEAGESKIFLDIKYTILKRE